MDVEGEGSAGAKVVSLEVGDDKAEPRLLVLVIWSVKIIIQLVQG